MSTEVDVSGHEIWGNTAFSPCHQTEINGALLNMDWLLCGETGSGKDTLANRIHEQSGRSGPFVGMNCAAIPEQLAESQLFGVVNGAFTGVCRSREGYIEASSGGTLYLDEIDSMPLSLQAKLLRVLETRGVERLGSTAFIPVDLRVIASAQRPLDQLVEQGLFRRDLFFRLNALTVHLPALRKRRDQILPLFDQFTQRIATEFGRPVPVLDRGRMQLLLSHDWSGNIRELKTAAKRFVLGFPLLGTDPVAVRSPVSSLRDQLRVIEKMLIQDALKRHRQNVEAVVHELDIPKRTLYHRMKELGVAAQIAASA